MRITTLNLQAFSDWKKRESKIVAYLKEIDPDIIFFQEVVFIPDTSPYNQVQLLNKQLCYPYENSAITRLQPSHEYHIYREGLSVLSKYPIVHADTIVLKQAEQDEHNRIVQFVDVDYASGVVKLANVHFSLTDTIDFATEHLKETLQIMADRGEERIIGGDFNMDDITKASALWTDRFTTSIQTSYISYPSHNKRIDYFLLPKQIGCNSIVTSPDGLSDHRAVTITIDALV